MINHDHSNNMSSSLASFFQPRTSNNHQTLLFMQASTSHAASSTWGARLLNRKPPPPSSPPPYDISSTAFSRKRTFNSSRRHGVFALITAIHTSRMSDTGPPPRKRARQACLACVSLTCFPRDPSAPTLNRASLSSECSPVANNSPRMQDESNAM